MTHAVWEVEGELRTLGQQAELGQLVSGQPAAPVLGEVCFGRVAGDCEGWSVLLLWLLIESGVD